MSKNYVVTCRYCEEVLLTARHILAPEVAHLVRHLEDRHAERNAAAGGLGALLRAFVVEREG